MLLQNNNKKEDYKTLKMEPCNPIVHLDGSMSVGSFFQWQHPRFGSSQKK